MGFVAVIVGNSTKIMHTHQTDYQMAVDSCRVTGSMANIFRMRNQYPCLMVSEAIEAERHLNAV